jgi:tetratricopeptide (TPR) repeat protein/predicted Ser/Thr protein kinase
MIANGTLLNGRYYLDAELGRGGMGVVYRAQDRLLQRPVAVKVLSQDGLGSEGRARLLREAQAAARLNHPNIVAVHDAGEAEGQSFVVMELVEGVSLFDRKPETIDETIRMARQICNALEHAHRNGIIHRDLKPENVLVAPDGTAKLMDFGLARSIASRLSQEGAVVGTVFYLAPEQALGKPLDGRADLYALGVMLYEFTTGQLPFAGDDPFAVITQHLHAPVVPPRAKNEVIPVALDTLIVRLMSKNPDERPASATAVIEMLDEVVSAPSRPLFEAPPEFSLLDRIVRGRIVGRESELAEASKLWERARRGEGQLLLVSGEPGVGKTRLVREIVTRAEVTGGLALMGECYAEGGAPFAPFAQMARSALHNGVQPPDLPDFVLADLLLLAPDLRLAYPQVPPNPSLDPQSDKARLFENVAAFCQALCRSTPLLLLLEDVHWADSGTVSLLHHLARRARRLPLLLVATYREVELDQARPLQALLLELNRERLGSQLKLGRLDKAGTQAMLEALFAEEISPEFLGAIYHETEGNPFFIEEVCKALVESGKLSFANGRWQRPKMSELEIPQSIRVAIQSRLTNLPDEAQEVLTLAAMLGRQFDYELLAAAGAYDENRLIQALESASRAQLVEETSDERGGTFHFTHALIPPILREALSGPRRRRYHRQVMSALETLRPDDLESLAHHALESGNLEKGLEYSLQAARKAYKLYALDEALHYTRHALDAAEDLDQADQTFEIYELMGDIHLLRGDFQACVDSLQRSLALAVESPKRVGLNSKIGMAYTWMGDERGLEYLEMAVREADPQTQANELANATAGIGRYHHFHGHHRQALSYLHKAYEIAEPLQDVVVLTAIYAYLAGAYQHLTEYPASIDWARRSIDLGERLNAPFAVAIGYEFLAEDALVGRWQEALQYAEQNRSIGARIGAMDRIAWSEFAQAQAYYGLGELDKAVEAAQSSLELAGSTGDIRLEVLAQYFLGVAQADMGDHEAALSAASQAQQFGTQLGQIYMLASGNYALAYTHALHGEWVKASELMDTVGAALWRTDSRVVPMFYFGFYGLTALKRGDLEKAERIIASNLTLTREAGSDHYQAEARHVLAQIRSAQGRQDEATTHFEQAIQVFERLGSRLEQGKALYYLGQAQIQWGQTQAGRESVESALQIFQACQANYWVTKALELTA